jgi:hypothetical protein
MECEVAGIHLRGKNVFVALRCNHKIDARSLRLWSLPLRGVPMQGDEDSS